MQGHQGIRRGVVNRSCVWLPACFAVCDQVLVVGLLACKFDPDGGPFDLAMGGPLRLDTEGIAEVATLLWSGGH